MIVIGFYVGSSVAQIKISKVSCIELTTKTKMNISTMNAFCTIQTSRKRTHWSMSNRE